MKLIDDPRGEYVQYGRDLCLAVSIQGQLRSPRDPYIWAGLIETGMDVKIDRMEGDCPILRRFIRGCIVTFVQGSSNSPVCSTKN